MNVKQTPLQIGSSERFLAFSFLDLPVTNKNQIFSLEVELDYCLHSTSDLISI
jgi:hypothetical protein